MAKILGIPLYNQNINKAVAEVKTIVNSAAPKLNRCISATGAHGIVYAQKNPNFKKILNEFFWNLPDGMPGVWVGKLKGEQHMERCNGPSFFQELLIASGNTKMKHFFCGGKEGIAEELKVECARKFMNENVVGTFSPPFREMSDEELIDLGHTIDTSGADVVWIGISTPKQELFAYRLRNYVRVHFIITVGAAFDFHTDKIKFAPTWIQNIGMEWFFRLLSEPSRLFRRYAEIVPLFIYYNIREFAYFCTVKIKKSW